MWGSVTYSLFEVSKFLTFAVLYLTGYLELNSHIYVLEDDVWAVKGRFTQAILDDDLIQWVASSKSKFSLFLLAVSLKCCL